MKSDPKLYKMELTKEEVEWIINRKKILDHMYKYREKQWMPYIYPDHVYKTDDHYAEEVWNELKRQIEND